MLKSSKSLNKKNKILILISILLLSFFCVYTSAQNINSSQDICSSSNICSTAPEPFRMLSDFIQEIANSIKTVGTEGNYAGKYVNPNRFQGTKFNPPKQNIGQKVLTDVQQKLTTLTAIGATIGGGAGDGIASTVISTKNKVFLRDWKKLDELNTLISDKKYELGLGGGWYDVINESNIKSMNVIIQKYYKKGILLESSKIENGVRYDNVMGMLTIISFAMKRLIAYNSIKGFNNDYSQGGLDGVTIRFNNEKLVNMLNEYNCAKGFNDKCDKNKTSFKESIKKIGAGAKNSVKKSIGIITGATQKLSKEIYAIAQSVKKTFSSGKEIKSKLVQVGGKIVKVNIDVSELPSINSGSMDNRRSMIQKNDEETIISDKTQSTIIYTNNLSRLTNPSIKDLLEQQKADMKSVALSDSQDITSKIDLMLNSINQDKKIIGTKDVGLIKNLGVACQNQCGGGGTCFY